MAGDGDFADQLGRGFPESERYLFEAEANKRGAAMVTLLGGLRLLHHPFDI